MNVWLVNKSIWMTTSYLIFRTIYGLLCMFLKDFLCSELSEKWSKLINTHSFKHKDYILFSAGYESIRNLYTFWFYPSLLYRNITSIKLFSLFLFDYSWMYNQFIIRIEKLLVLAFVAREWMQISSCSIFQSTYMPKVTKKFIIQE